MASTLCWSPLMMPVTKREARKQLTRSSAMADSPRCWVPSARYLPEVVFLSMKGPHCRLSHRVPPTLPSLGPTVFNRVILNTEQLTALGREESYIDALPAVQAFYATYQRRTGSAPPELYRHFLAYGYDAM